MLCPGCLTRIPLDGSATIRSIDPARAVHTDSAPAPAAEVAPAEIAAAVAAGEPPATAGESRPADEWMIACPRCNLHFQPRDSFRVSKVSRKTILVVEDLAYFRQVAKDTLEPIFEVTTAANTAQARDLLGRMDFDLLVLDLTIDGHRSGRDFLSRLNPKPCPILIFTAQDESDMYGESWEDLKRLGADDLVIKGMKVADSLYRKASMLLGIPVDEEDAIG